MSGHYASDFRTEDDPLRAAISLMVLEMVGATVLRFKGFKSGHVEMQLVTAAIDYGCAVRSPLGVSSISHMTHLSRHKVYDCLDELRSKGWYHKVDVLGIPYPVYVPNLDHVKHQETKPLTHYDRMLQIATRLKPFCQAGASEVT